MYAWLNNLLVMILIFGGFLLACEITNDCSDRAARNCLRDHSAAFCTGQQEEAP